MLKHELDAQIRDDVSVYELMTGPDKFYYAVLDFRIQLSWKMDASSGAPDMSCGPQAISRNFRDCTSSCTLEV